MKRYSFLFIIPVLLVSSCKKWLDVSSTTEIVSEQQFKDVTGFRDAVVGVYVKMAKPELYSKDMTWLTVEFLSQQYAVVASNVMNNVPLYNWDASPLPAKRQDIWLGMYNAIANINQILRYQQQNRDVFSGFPVTDTLIRGEMLALRAYLHFDLMRLFGKSNLGGNPSKMNELAIPYVTDFVKTPTAQRSYRETIDLMKKDIEEAIVLLEADPLSRLRPSTYWTTEAANNFISTSSTGTASPNRKMRMNYWAAKALYARILMWEGTSESKAKALQLALDVMGSSLSNGIGTGSGAYYTWAASGTVNAADKFQSDLAFVNEQLFTLQVENFITIQTAGTTASNWFNAASPNSTYNVAYLTDARVKSIFESDNTQLYATDWRRTRGLEAAGSSLTNWEVRKFYNVAEMSANYSKRMPMIRVSEMFYIAAECYITPGSTYDRAKAVACLNWVRSKRNIPASQNLEAGSLTDTQIRDEITKEYMKEFIGEGQLFFYYKRLGTPFIPNYASEMTDAQYQMPMPEDEIINGGGRTN